jgi:hypothetical protein
MINTILGVAASLLVIGVVGGITIWSLVWFLKKLFKLDE